MLERASSRSIFLHRFPDSTVCETRSCRAEPLNVCLVDCMLRGGTAQEYTDRKIVTLKENALLAQRALMAKRSDYQAVTSTLQMRMSQMQQVRK